MTDIALRWRQTHADFSIVANDLESDDGLETAVIISLFTDRRADRTDILPDTQISRRGWWGDLFNGDAQDRIGSKLWLLGREKQTEETRLRAIGYAQDALQWLVDDRVLDTFTVDGEWIDRGILGLTVTLDRPRTDTVEYRFNYSWDAQALRTSEFIAEAAGLTFDPATTVELFDGVPLTFDDNGHTVTFI